MQYPYLHFLQQSCKEKGILHVAFFGFLLWFVGVFCCLGAASGSSSANLWMKLLPFLMVVELLVLDSFRFSFSHCFLVNEL